jgi:hypothetical protein
MHNGFAAFVYPSELQLTRQSITMAVKGAEESNPAVGDSHLSICRSVPP